MTQFDISFIQPNNKTSPTPKRGSSCYEPNFHRLRAHCLQCLQYDPNAQANNREDNHHGKNGCPGPVCRRNLLKDDWILRVRFRTSCWVALRCPSGILSNGRHLRSHQVRRDDTQCAHLTPAKSVQRSRFRKSLVWGGGLTCCPTPLDPSHVVVYHSLPHILPFAPPTHCPAAPMAFWANFGMIWLYVKGAS